MLSWVFLIGCATPDPCVDMCRVATEAHSECLVDWEAQWTDFGYSDAEDFQDSCDTWAWEMRLLESDARRSGDLEESGKVDAVCLERELFLSSEPFDCESWSTINWNETPWNR